MRHSAVVVVLAFACSACGSMADRALAAAQEQNSEVVSVRNVHSNGTEVCGDAIDQHGRIDRFFGITETFGFNVDMESQIDRAMEQARSMDPDIAVAIIPGLKLGFMRDYRRCIARSPLVA